MCGSQPERQPGNFLISFLVVIGLHTLIFPGVTGLKCVESMGIYLDKVTPQIPKPAFRSRLSPQPDLNLNRDPEKQSNTGCTQNRRSKRFYSGHNQNSSSLWPFDPLFDPSFDLASKTKKATATTDVRLFYYCFTITATEHSPDCKMSMTIKNGVWSEDGGRSGNCYDEFPQMFQITLPQNFQNITTCYCNTRDVCNPSNRIGPIGVTTFEKMTRILMYFISIYMQGLPFF